MTIGRALAVAALLAVAARGPDARAQSFDCATHGDGTCTRLVPDANGGVAGALASRITVPAGACPGGVARLRVGVRLTHSAVGDLRLRLSSPAGTGVTLLAPSGCMADDVDATFEDAGGSGVQCDNRIPAFAGSLAPAEPLAAFVHEPGAGVWTLTITDATHAGLGALDGWSLACAEDCEDCRDDDGNGAVDGDDGACPVARGGGAGLPGAEGKALVRCAKTLQKLGGAFATTRLARTHACAAAVFACVQRKPGDAGCLARAQKTCGRHLAKVGRAGDRLAGGVARTCGGVPVESLRALAGLGFAAADGPCAARGVGSLGSAADVAACVRARHACTTDRLLAVELPRARELVALGGRDPAAEFPCLGAVSDGGGAGLGDPGRGRAAARCASALGKAGAKLVGAAHKALGRCAAASFACVQRGGGSCLGRASRACARASAKVAALRGKSAGTALRGCGRVPLDDLLAPAGLGFVGAGPPCTSLGGGVGSAAAVAECAARFHACRTTQLLEAVGPRFRELVGLAGAVAP